MFIGAVTAPLSGPGWMLIKVGRGEHGRRSWPGLRSRPCGESWHEHLGGRCLVAEGCMRPDGIVQHDDGTPTGSGMQEDGRSSIAGILGPDAWLMSTR